MKPNCVQLGKQLMAEEEFYGILGLRLRSLFSLTTNKPDTCRNARKCCFLGGEETEADRHHGGGMNALDFCLSCTAAVVLPTALLPRSRCCVFPSCSSELMGVFVWGTEAFCRVHVRTERSVSARNTCYLSTGVPGWRMDVCH